MGVRSSVSRAPTRSWSRTARAAATDVATAFSNNPESHQSSLGLFETQQIRYSGKNGYSLRLKGLDAGFNDRALAARHRHARRALRQRTGRQSSGTPGPELGCPGTARRRWRTRSSIASGATGCCSRDYPLIRSGWRLRDSSAVVRRRQPDRARRRRSISVAARWQVQGNRCPSLATS